jgi:hypothetical protein
MNAQTETLYVSEDGEHGRTVLGSPGSVRSPVITSFLVSWNDSMDDVDRQMLKPYIVRVVGTRTGKRHEEQRAWMLTDWLARECASAWKGDAARAALAPTTRELQQSALLLLDRMIAVSARGGDAT